VRFSAFRSGVALGGLVSVVVSAWILFWLPGWSYYRTPVAERGYHPAHALLRPSGPYGQTFGVVGTALMLVPALYMLRKRLGRRGPGNLKTFLEVHLFAGIVGPVLVTFHTSFKFNGLVSAAYWSMVLVVLSGFVGRYLYTQIPRSLRGTELTRAELDREADALREDALSEIGDGPAVATLDAVDRAAAGGRASWTGLLLGEIGLRWRVHRLVQALGRSGLSAHRQARLVHITLQRALLLRRATYLQKTKSAFGLWHVFHLPLVHLMGGIAFAHVALVLYLGYVPFRW